MPNQSAVVGVNQHALLQPLLEMNSLLQSRHAVVKVDQHAQEGPTLLKDSSNLMLNPMKNSTSSTLITQRCCTKETGVPIKNLDLMITTAQLPNPTTGRVLNNALNPGNAEVLGCAKEADGALDLMAVRDP